MEKATLDFLAKLKKNNNKEWFAANKKLYEAALTDYTAFIEALLGEIVKFDASLKAVRAKDTLFRIYRDVRFAKDKSPYKPNFGANMAAGGRMGGPGYYFHMEAGGSFLAGGIHQPETKTLQKIREQIAERPDELRKIIAAPAFKKKFGGLAGEELKTAPRGFAKDHPALDLLKRKEFIVFQQLTDAEVLGPKLKKLAAESFFAMLPLNQFLAKSVGRK